MPGAVSPIVVLGVGNLLRRDEGVGVHVVRALSGDGGAPAELVDGGTAVFEALSGWQEIGKLVVIDALQAEREPGSVTRLRLEEASDRNGPALSLHQYGLLDALALLRQAGLRLGEVVIYGVEPAETDWGTELSEPVARRLPRLLEQVREELEAYLGEEKIG